MTHAAPPAPDCRSDPPPDRRRFLTGSALAAVAVAAGSGVRAAVTETPEEQLKARYRVTPHVERFYALNSL